VDESLREDIKLNIMNKKVEFEKKYQKMDLIMEVIDKDKDF